MKHSLVISTIAVSFSLFACSSDPTAIGTDRATGEKVAEYTYEVVNIFPHDPGAYTQGLVFASGELYESTGRYGDSSLRRVDLNTGSVVQKLDIAQEFFAEGLTILDDKVFLLTWREGKAFVYDRKTFQKTNEFQYSGDGWGLTHDGQLLIMTDGTNRIRFIDPQTFKTRRTIKVEENGKPLMNLNELEFVNGEIFANVWQQERIVRIDPKDGKLLGAIDMRGLLDPAKGGSSVDVLNGIAYDAAGDRLFVTGKLWPKLFEIRLKKKS